MPSADKWDAAISLLKRDLAQANAVARNLQGQARVFIYENHPERTVGTNGVVTFSDVFGDEAALVVVLYRQAWGTTKWTKIEQRAIREHLLDQGDDDRLILIMMEPCETPRWWPRTRIYGEWSALGAKRVADIILARLGDLGKQLKPETPVEQARRLSEQQAWDSKRRDLLSGIGGAEAAYREAEKMFAEVEKHAANIDGCRSARDNGTTVEYKSRLVLFAASRSAKELLIQIFDGPLLWPHQPSGPRLKHAAFILMSSRRGCLVGDSKETSCRRQTLRKRQSGGY